LLYVIPYEPSFDSFIQSEEAFPFGLDLELSQGLRKGHQGLLQ
jgi:hypothetical protein